jgi:hypothetical protein
MLRHWLVPLEHLLAEWYYRVSLWYNLWLLQDRLLMLVLGLSALAHLQKLLPYRVLGKRLRNGWLDCRLKLFRRRRKKCSLVYPSTQRLLRKPLQPPL